MRELIERAAVCVSLVCLIAAASACSSQTGSASDSTAASLRTQEPAATSKTAAHADGLGFSLVNFTGNTIRAVYVSPSDSKGWEENVLGVDKLSDGDAVDIHFSPRESAALWDIRVVSMDEHSAEWKGLDLRGVSQITLLLNLIGEPTVVAEVE